MFAKITSTISISGILLGLYFWFTYNIPSKLHGGYDFSATQIVALLLMMLFSLVGVVTLIAISLFHIWNIK